MRLAFRRIVGRATLLCWAISCCAIGLSGCTLINAPNEGLLDSEPPQDSGVDADAVSDGGDAGMPDGSMPDASLSENCNNRKDDDGNGLTDCSDFSCVSFPDCCSSEDGVEIFSEDWADDRLFDLHWHPVPLNAAQQPSREAGWIDDFGMSGNPRGFIRRTCRPLTLGLEITVLMDTVPTQPCEGQDCPYARVILTAATNAIDGNPLESELAVTLNSVGVMTVSGSLSSGTSRSAQVVGADSPGVEVTIRVGPGFDQENRPITVATVRTQDQGAAATSVTVADHLPVFLSQDLLNHPDDRGCEASPGLYIAVEGRSEGVRVGNLQVTQLECANPSRFNDPAVGNVSISHDDLMLDDWARGTLRDPALISTCVGEACELRWDVMTSATTVDPSVDLHTHLGYAIGHSVTSDWVTWNGSGGPRLGEDPPFCTESPCEVEGPSYRQPHLLPSTNEFGEIDANGLWVTYAVESGAALSSGIRDRFEIQVASNFDETPTSDAPDTATTLVEPSELCASVEDPNLVNAGLNDSSDLFWLFYTCYPPDGGPSTIRARELNSTLQGIPDTDRLILDSVRAEGHGSSWAAAGVRGPEPAVVIRTTASLRKRAHIRLWFRGVGSAGSQEQVGLAVASVDENLDSLDFVNLPPATAFAMYPNNPVFSADSPLLPECEGVCTLLGFAVARQADGGVDADLQIFRFLVARMVLLDSTIRYELVPLEQIWKIPS